jgi:hypothetical protein
MKDSLKNKLFEAIKGDYPNMFSLERVEDLAREAEHKVSNAERRLRELCDPNDAGYAPVKAIRNDKGFITGYLYQEPQLPQRQPETEVKQDALFNYQGTFLRT